MLLVLCQFLKIFDNNRNTYFILPVKIFSTGFTNKGQNPLYWQADYFYLYLLDFFFFFFQSGVIFGPFCFLPFTIFSGFFVQLNASHPAFRWIFHISFLKYGFEGLLLSVLGYDREKLPCKVEDYCHYTSPKRFLSDMDMEYSTYSLAVIFLVCLCVALRIVAFIALNFKVRNSRQHR